MKKFATIAVIALAGTFILPSCKKDYKCTCTINGVASSADLKGYKKSDAKDACAASNTAAAVFGGNCSLD